MVTQLVVGKMRSDGANHVPPSSSTNGSCTDVSTDGHVTEEKPSGDKTLVGAARRFVHNVQIRRVEAQGSGWQTISDQIDPQELDGDQSFGQTKSSSQEDADNL